MSSPSTTTIRKPTFRRGLTLGHKEREIVYNVHQYFQREKEEKGPIQRINAVIARTSAATGISVATLRRILQKGPEFNTP